MDRSQRLGIIAALLVIVSTGFTTASFGQVRQTELQAPSTRLSGLIGTRQFSNVPDDIGYQLNESDEQIDALFPVGPLEPIYRRWSRMTKHLRESARLDLGLNYTTVYQRADTTLRGPRDSADGDVDFFGRWHLTGCEDRNPGSLVFNTESRHRLSGIPPKSLNTGTLGGTIVGFGLQDFSLVQMYWEQGSIADGAVVRIGKMDPALIYDGGRYVSDNYAFLSPFFSDTVPLAFAGAGLAIAGAIYPTDSTYVAAGIHDANGQRTTSGFNTFFREGEFFTALEAGWYPNDGNQNEGLYHITFWQIDARTKARRPSDQGIALTLEQQFGWVFVPFLRYAYADRGLNDVRQNVSLGIGFEEAFGRNYDLVAAGLSWQEPSDRALRDQYVFETFYRLHITPRTHITPDIQVVIDPANAPTKSAVTVFGLRLRTLY